MYALDYQEMIDLLNVVRYIQLTICALDFCTNGITQKAFYLVLSSMYVLGRLSKILQYSNDILQCKNDLFSYTFVHIEFD